MFNLSVNNYIVRMFTRFSTICVLCLIIVSQSFPVTEETRAALYLQKCGNLDNSIGNGYPFQVADHSLSNALKDFQRFNGLKQTGLLDNNTTALMKNLRCSDKNNIGHSGITRKKIYALLGIDVTLMATDEIGYNLDLGKKDEKNTPISIHNETYLLSNMNDLEAKIPLYSEKSQTLPEKEISSPDACLDSSIDAATRTQNGQTYFFKGDFYWRIIVNRIADGYPRRIANDWSGLDGNLDAALTWSNGWTFIFKGSMYWKSINKEMESGYPKLISQGFPGIPDNIDAAFVSPKDGKTYFFKGDKYWQYDSKSEPAVDKKYPLPISDWSGLPSNLDAAFQFENKMSYFFKDGTYYRIYKDAFKVDVDSRPYPRSTSRWWFSC